MPSTTINRGNVLSTTIITPSITPVAVASYTSAGQTFNIPGLLTTDLVQAIGANGVQTTGIVIGECDCFANNVLTVQFLNVTNASATPIAGNYSFMVSRLEGPAPANMA